MYLKISVLSRSHKQQANGKYSIKIGCTDFCYVMDNRLTLPCPLTSYIVSDLYFSPVLNLNYVSRLPKKTSHPACLSWHANQWAPSYKLPSSLALSLPTSQMQTDSWRTDGKTESVSQCERFPSGKSTQWSRAPFLFLPRGGEHEVLFTDSLLWGGRSKVLCFQKMEVTVVWEPQYRKQKSHHKNLRANSLYEQLTKSLRYYLYAFLMHSLP